MKRIISLLLVLILAFSFSLGLVSCKKDKDEGKGCSHRDKDDDGKCDKCDESYTDNKDVDDTPIYTRDGDYIYFGEYPQTVKADDVTVTSEKDSRGYYLGSDGCYYAKVVAKLFNSGYKFSTGEEIIKDNIYYFKVEPIRWRILLDNGDSALILCDSIISNQPWQSNYTYDDGAEEYYTNANGAPIGTYTNNYKYSEIRQWLNAKFYEYAFSELQREIILTTMIDNSLSSTGYTENPYVCENTEDKAFVLSHAEATNIEYGFKEKLTTQDEFRQMKTSDYSRATGIYIDTDDSCYGNSSWWLRTPEEISSERARCVNTMGGSSLTNVYYKCFGVVPALRIKL